MSNFSEETATKAENKIKIMVIIIIVAFLFIPIGFFIYYRIFSATIKILVAPQEATIKINGNIVRNLNQKVQPGIYVVTAEMNGFETEEQEIRVETDETESAYFILEPNTDETADWYETHPDDARMAEGISGWRYDNAVQKQDELYPIIKKLPYETSIYRISYGSYSDGEFYISVNAASGLRSVALKRFLQLDDPGKYNFYFIDYINPFEGEG